MKKVATKFLLLGSLGLLVMVSCKKNDAIVTTNGGKPGTLAASITTIPLEKSKQSDTTKVINFSFTKANYGFSAAVTNTLQIDAASDNFAKPMSITLAPNVTSQGYATADFNSILLKLNLPSGVASQVQARLVQTVSTGIKPIYSNTLALTVTPYNLAVFVYIPGNYEGWANPGTAEDSLQSPTGNGIYTGVIPIKLVGDQFLLTPVKNWANKYATTDGQGAAGGPITYTTEYVTGGGNNFYSASIATVDPNVFITANMAVLNTNNNTFTLTPTQWSVVGDGAGGWPNTSGPQSDIDMTFNNGTQTWSVVTALKVGAIKFRLNHDWGKNYGSVTTAGVLDTADNNNINITVAGTYLITVDIAHLTYTVVKQ